MAEEFDRLKCKQAAFSTMVSKLLKKVKDSLASKRDQLSESLELLLERIRSWNTQFNWNGIFGSECSCFWKKSEKMFSSYKNKLI